MSRVEGFPPYHAPEADPGAARSPREPSRSPLRAYLLTLAPERPVFLPASPESTPAPEPRAPRPGWRGRIDAKVRVFRNYLTHSQGTVPRLARRLWAWLQARAHPDEALLARLQTASEVILYVPIGVDPIETLWAPFLARARRRHLGWFVWNVALAPFTVVLGPLPGPNLIAYWVVYRAYRDFLILRGIKRTRTGALTTRVIPTPALDLPLSDPVTTQEFDRLIALGCEPEHLRPFLHRQGLSPQAATPPAPR